MIIKLKHDPQKQDTEVQVSYPKMSSFVSRLINKIEACDYFIMGYDGEKQYQIPLDEVFYIESVDKRTFIYCKNKVYQSQMKLYQFLNEISKYDFVQISKSCILNLNVLVCIKPLFNSRMEATLKNGENVSISRKFISTIKEKLGGEG